MGRFTGNTRIGIATALLVLTVLDRALACECRTADICEKTELAPIIFLGEVIEGGLDPGEDAWSGRATHAKLRIVEAFKGLPPGTKEVEMNLSYLPDMCSPAVYRRGEQTLVFTSRDKDGSLHDGACSGSRFAKDVPEELKYVRDYTAGRTQTTIRGRIAANRPASLVSYVLDDSDGQPVEGAQVWAESAKGNFAVQTNRLGEFEFVGIPAGGYRLHAAKAGYRNTEDHYEEPSDFEVAVNAKGCAIQDLALWTRNRVQGTIRGADGTAANNISVFLEPINGSGKEEEEETDARGEFKFERVNPGRYHVVVSPTGATSRSPYERRYYLNTAGTAPREVVIEPTSDIRSVRIQLGPELQKRTILIDFQWPDGRPIEDAFALCGEALEDEAFRKNAQPVSINGGVGACTALVGRSIRIQPTFINGRPDPLDTKPITVPTGAENVKVTLKVGPKDAAAAQTRLR